MLSEQRGHILIVKQVIAWSPERSHTSWSGSSGKPALTRLAPLLRCYGRKDPRGYSFHLCPLLIQGQFTESYLRPLTSSTRAAGVKRHAQGQLSGGNDRGAIAALLSPPSLYPDLVTSLLLQPFRPPLPFIDIICNDKSSDCCPNSSRLSLSLLFLVHFFYIYVLTCKVSLCSWNAIYKIDVLLTTRQKSRHWLLCSLRFAVNWLIYSFTHCVLLFLQCPCPFFFILTWL